MKAYNFEMSLLMLCVEDGSLVTVPFQCNVSKTNARKKDS